MKQVFSLLLASLAALVFAGNISANETALNLNDISKRLPAKIFNDVSQIPDKPHFLEGFKRETDEWEKFVAARRFFRTMNLIDTGVGEAMIDKSKPGYEPAPGETAIFMDLSLEGKSVRLIHSHYHMRQDGMHTFWSRRFGEKNLAELSPRYEWIRTTYAPLLSEEQWKDAKRVLGWAEFQAVHAFVKDMVAEGLEKAVRDYGEMKIEERVKEIRSKILSDPEYASRLNEPIPGIPGLTVADKLPVPRTQPKDFLPDIIIVSPSEFIGGFTNAWKTPESERIVFLSLGGLAYQYIDGFSLASHEFVHANPYLQGTPISAYFDVELFAALTNDLSDGTMNYLFHPYLSVVREMAMTYFGYDFREAARNIRKGSLGVTDIRPEELRKHVKLVGQIRDELLRFIKDPEDGFMVRFYSDPYYWLTVNTKYCDTAAALRIMMELYYEKTGIYDPNRLGEDGLPVPPAVQTKEWIQKELDSGRIKRLAEAALAETGKESDFAKKVGKMETMEFSKCPVHSRFFFMNEAEQERFESTVGDLVARMKKGDRQAVYILRKIFAGTGALSVLELPATK